jgi:hypothetical protein
MSGKLHVPATLSLTIEPQYPLIKRLGGPHGRYGRRGEETNLDSAGIPTPGGVSSIRGRNEKYIQDFDWNI